MDLKRVLQPRLGGRTVALHIRPSHGTAHSRVRASCAAARHMLQQYRTLRLDQFKRVKHPNLISGGVGGELIKVNKACSTARIHAVELVLADKVTNVMAHLVMGAPSKDSTVEEAARGMMLREAWNGRGRSSPTYPGQSACNQHVAPTSRRQPRSNSCAINALDTDHSDPTSPKTPGSKLRGKRPRTSMAFRDRCFS